MSEDLIKRSDAINLCEKWRNRTNEHHDKNGWYIADTLLKAIKELPLAGRPQGEWINIGGYEVCKNYHEVKMFPHWNFCPNCGAPTKGADDHGKTYEVVANGNCTICGKPLSGDRVFICEECSKKGADDGE